nr:RHS repeat-associated core domain-containing protein [Leptospiraceae bacterium]
GQGGGTTGSGSNGSGTPVAGMIFFHNDQIGSTNLMTNTAGEMVTGSNGAANIVYNPYGDIDVDHSHGPDILRHKFTGQQLDNESGLYYYNARYYDPALGRFITADSVTDAGGDPDGMNAYMYAGGNPVRFNDPSGHIKSSQLKKFYPV